MSDQKMSSSRKHNLKSLMLGIAKGLLEAEAAAAEAARTSYMENTCPPLNLPESIAELQELCEQFHSQIDKIDEERYDMERKVNICTQEIFDLKIKIQHLQGKFKKPSLKKVRLSADSMLQALLGSKHNVNMDLRANLKQVKKEVKEESVEQVTDWRKNIEDKAGMGGRKKMFESS